MQWIKPEFEEISLGLEVTAYVNTDEQVLPREEFPAEALPVPRSSEELCAGDG